MAQARRDGEDRETVGALSLGCVLVSVEKPGYQDGGKIIRAGRLAMDRSITLAPGNSPDQPQASILAVVSHRLDTLAFLAEESKLQGSTD